MKEQFVPYEIAVMLKEKGFDEPCFGDYFHFERDNQSILDYDEDRERIITDNTDENITKYLAPLWQQVIDWLKSKGILITELWDGWEYAKLEEDFTYVQTKEQAIEHALTLI
jgi:hypothetical protein